MIICYIGRYFQTIIKFNSTSDVKREEDRKGKRNFWCFFLLLILSFTLWLYTIYDTQAKYMLSNLSYFCDETEQIKDIKWFIEEMKIQILNWFLNENILKILCNVMYILPIWWRKEKRYGAKYK